MHIEVPWTVDEIIDSRDVEPEGKRIAEELIVVAELLDPIDELRFLRTLVATLQAEQKSLAALMVGEDNPFPLPN